MAQHQPVRRQHWAGQTPQQILQRYRPGKAPPLEVLEVLLELFNALHTSLEKTVSHKTRHERSQFLRRFFRDLHDKAGFKKLPDPRNLGQKHLRAMVKVWQQEHLAPATIQTYLSFLRGLGMWMGKHGFVREPAYYGLGVEEYQRHESAQRDKSWSGNGVDIDALIAEVYAYDRYVGASLRLIRAMGLRRKESVQFRPFENVVSFADTGLPAEERAADRYVRVKGKGGRVRWIPLDGPERLAALEVAQAVVGSRDAHMGDPSRDPEEEPAALRLCDGEVRHHRARARSHGAWVAARGADRCLPADDRRTAAGAGRRSRARGGGPGGTTGRVAVGGACAHEVGRGLLREVAGCTPLIAGRGSRSTRRSNRSRLMTAATRWMPERFARQGGTGTAGIRRPSRLVWSAAMDPHRHAPATIAILQVCHCLQFARSPRRSSTSVSRSSARLTLISRTRWSARPSRSSSWSGTLM